MRYADLCAMIETKGSDYTGDYLCEALDSIELRDLIFEMYDQLHRNPYPYTGLGL